MEIGYSKKVDPEKTAKAIGKELQISPKYSTEICKAIRGMKVEDAKEYLTAVVEMKKPVRCERYVKQVTHKRGKKFGAGRYPVKAASQILRVIESALENAEYKGLDTEGMRLIHISANRGRVWKGYIQRAHGRSSAHNRLTTNIEVILEEEGLE
ncbi:MAG: 50S ribosomal protein L22 [Candidatus Thermoplasmatota archaeon]